MKKMSLLIVFLSFLGILCLPLMSYAQGMNDSNQVFSDSTRNIDQQAATPNGQQEVVSRLKSQFNVSDDQINRWRNQNLGFGDINMVLLLSQKLPGGTSNENIDKVINLRQANPNQGWGPLSQQLGVDMNQIQGRLTQVGIQNQNTQNANGTATTPPQAGAVSGTTNSNLVTGQPVGSNGLITGQNQRFTTDGTAQNTTGTSAGGTTTGGLITGSTNPSTITGQGQTQQNQGSSRNSQVTPSTRQTGR